MPINHSLLNIRMDDWEGRIPVRRHVEVANVTILPISYEVSSHNMRAYYVDKYYDRSLDEVVRVLQATGATDVNVAGNNQWEMTALIEHLIEEGYNVTNVEALREVRAIISIPVVESPKVQEEEGELRDALDWLLTPEI